MGLFYTGEALFGKRLSFCGSCRACACVWQRLLSLPIAIEGLNLTIWRLAIGR